MTDDADREAWLGKTEERMNWRDLPASDKPAFERHLPCGCLAGGPLLFPGRPFMFDGSCCRTVGFSWLSVELEPTVPGLTAGPLLFPGIPGIHAPEFCALGAVETSG